MTRKIVWVQGLPSAVPDAQLSFTCLCCHTASWGRNWPSVWCVRAHASRRAVLQDRISDPKMMREKLWRELFSKPSEWWDNRSEKVNPRYPDFKHKRTGQSLWLDNGLTPPWLETELAQLAPGLFQSDIFSWNVKLRRHLKAQDYKKTLNLFEQMQRKGMVPDKFTFVVVLNACSKLRSLEEGTRVHKQIIQRGCESEIYVANCLIDMYAKCGSIEDAWSVFNKMWERDVVSWNTMIGGYVKSEQAPKALDFFRKMQLEGLKPNRVTFLGVLTACASLAALEEGRRVHAQISRTGWESDVYVANCLVNMYAKCGCIEDAWSVFNKMGERNVVSWTAMIVGYVKSEQGLKALELFEKMQQEGVVPNTITFVAVLNACASSTALEEGRRFHEQIIQSGCDSDVLVANCLVDMYAKCGSIIDAGNVFKRIRKHSVASWNAMIGAYVKYKQGPKALKLFRIMQQEGIEPDTVTYVGALNACASIAALAKGRHVHKQIIRRGCESDVYVANCLVDMYAKCGSIEDARHVFERMPERNVVSWNAMIGGYVKSEQGLKALELVRKMQKEGIEPDAVTFIGALNACASVAALGEGRVLHKQIIRKGCDSDVYVANCLIDMYAKCGSIEEARIVFNLMQKRSVVSWNAMIGGYVKFEQGLKSLNLYQKMQQEGMEPDSVTFVGALNACASVADLQQGRRVHKQIIRRGYESDIYVANCLLDMYAKCGSIKNARSMFNKMQEHDVVSWNAMIGCYVKFEEGLKALELFREMQQEGVEPNALTFVGVLNACASVAALKEGTSVHGQIIQRGLESDIFVANCLIDMYAKCGSIEDAWNVFNNMRERCVVSWSAMIVGYVKSEQGLKALQLFQKMQQEGVEPNTITFVGVLNACASIATLEEGRHVHEQIIRKGCESDVYVATCLVDMYAKCGSIEDAWSVFTKMQDRSVVCWNAILEGYAMHGHPKKAIELFEKMAKEGIEIDEITFTCLLSACSHGGLVEEGLCYFNTMRSRYKVSATREHYACMVNLLGRAGRLEEAEEMTKRSPMETDSCLWRSLLGACRIHRNINMAEQAAKRCWELDHDNAAAHVLLSNMYAGA